ncbi:hypothetical protein CCLMGIMDO_CCLMGIMDO_01434 [Companilactobacillus crustorum]|uniref:Cell surface protein n=4 Tax=Companilactobacillus TaxID=2767879 RepID=A0A837RFE1_9LACO|nr:cell surface protein precursor [Companilactobacillus crustorum JCM 15951]KRO20510.1 cell surface protein precursor [Companilactobacillus crustorum]
MPPPLFSGDKIMKKALTIFIVFYTGILLFLATNFQIAAAAVGPMINYNVAPEVASNQLDKKVGYYDLRVTPGQIETIKFKINNNDTKDHTYKISVNRATTDVNGVIVYNKHNEKPDRDLKYNIENLVTYPKEVSVDAKATKEVSMIIKIPQQKFEGELLGGILIEENNQIENAKPVKGVSLKNKYDYVLGLQLQQNAESIKPDLKLTKAYQTSDNGQIFVAAEMDNDVPTLEKDVSVKAQVTPENSNKVILKSSKEKMSIAPDSTFEYPVNVNSVTGPNKNKRLKPGRYTMYLDVKANNSQNDWKLKRNFTISKQQNNKLNKKVPDRSKDIWIILGGIGILIVVAGSVIYAYRKNKR